MEVAALVISIVSLIASGGVAAGVAWWIQKRMDKRELTKWRRDTLTKATAEFHRADNDFNMKLINYIYPEEETSDAYLDLHTVMAELDTNHFLIEATESTAVYEVTSNTIKYYETLLEELAENNTLKFESQTVKNDYHDKYLSGRPSLKNLNDLLKQDLEMNL